MNILTNIFSVGFLEESLFTFFSFSSIVVYDHTAPNFNMARPGVIDPLSGSTAYRTKQVTFKNDSVKWPHGDGEEKYKQQRKRKGHFSRLTKEKLDWKQEPTEEEP